MHRSTLFALALALVLAGCASTLNFSGGPAGAEVYVTDYAPSATQTPTVYEFHGTLPTTCEIDYFAWEKYYVWVGKEGYQPYVQSIRNEIKPGPAVAAVFCLWPLAIWAYGPDDAPIQVDLQAK